MNTNSIQEIRRATTRLELELMEADPDALTVQRAFLVISSHAAAIMDRIDGTDFAPLPLEPALLSAH